MTSTARFLTAADGFPARFMPREDAARFLGMSVEEFRAKVEPRIVFLRVGPKLIRFERTALARFRPGHQSQHPAETSGRLVYFIGPVDGGPIKIGTTRNLSRRLGHLQTASPVRLRVLAVVRGDFADEVRLHARFAAHRLHGEWFSPVQELLDLVASLGRGAGQ